MKRIAVDMDNVLADITEQFIRYHEKEFGERKTIKEITGISDLEAFPNARKYLYQQGFFATPPVIENSQQILAELNKKYEVFIVSAAMEFPQSLPEKQEW
ncbi:MAG: 5'(3')-deoxyribonucleotidase, partial [Bacteroidetes bacterium]|nr:5'(3')-deoxyribonucleotidase [Bacteroidota bacterium]